jgi:hypothetical protein
MSWFVGLKIVLLWFGVCLFRCVLVWVVVCFSV